MSVDEKLISQMLSKIPALEDEKTKYPAWKDKIDYITSIKPLDRMSVCSSLPKMPLGTDEQKKTALEKVKSYVTWMQVMRAQIFMSCSEDVQLELKSLDGWTAAEAFIEMKDQNEENLKSLYDEFCFMLDGKLMMDKKAHVSVVLKHIDNRMTSSTPFGLQLSLEAFLQVSKSAHEKYATFAARVKADARHLRERKVLLDDMMIKSVLQSKLPDHAQSIVTDNRHHPELSVDAVIERLTAHYVDMELDEERQRKAASTVAQEKKEESTTQVLAIQGSFGAARDGGGQHGGRGRGRGRGHGRGGHGGRPKGPRCFKCGKFGHKQDVCRSTQKPSEDKPTGKSEYCSYCHSHHPPDRCYKKAFDDMKKLKLTETHVMSINVRSANSVAPANKSGVQVDNAADEHICGDLHRFKEGSLVQLKEPLKIGGVGGSSLVANAKGDILLPLCVNEKRVNTLVQNVLFVEKYDGPLILSLGQWTKKGFSYFHEGCRNGGAGKLHVLCENELMLSATQTGESERLYVDMCEQESTNNIPETPKVGAARVVESCAPVSDGVCVNSSSFHSAEASKKSTIEVSPTTPLPAPVACSRDDQHADSARVESAQPSERGVQCGDAIRQLVKAYAKLSPELQLGKQEELLQIVHRKLGHACKEVCVETLRSCGVQINNKKVGDSLRDCHSCIVGKFKREGHHGARDMSDIAVGEEWSCDTFGPTQTQSLGGSQYFAVLVCRRSRFAFVVFGRKRDEVASKLVETLKLIKNFYKKDVRVLRSDNAGEFRVLSEYCKENGIKETKTVAGESQQNGQAERYIGVLTAMGRTLRLAAGASLGFWAECINHAVWLHNRIPHFCCGWRTPLFLFTGETCMLDRLAPFGCAVYAPLKDASKMGAQAERAVFLGYDAQRDGVRVWSPQLRKAVTVWGARFQESVFPWQEKKKQNVECDEFDLSYLNSASKPSDSSLSKPLGVSCPQILLSLCALRLAASRTGLLLFLLSDLRLRLHLCR